MEEAGRSAAWVWLVVGGFVVGGVLLWHVISNAINSLPDEIRDRVRSSVRTNARPLVVSAVVLTWTLAYLLYSVAVLPPPTTRTDIAAGTRGVAGTGAYPVSGGEVSDESLAPNGGASRSANGATVQADGGGSAGRGGSYSVGAPPARIKEANLYSGASNTIGITDKLIKVCGHAPLIFGQVLNTKPEDLLVFWRYLNDKGGIYGRKFEVTLEDDRYTAEGSVPAAQACAERRPFMIFGALGSDVIPPVRQWAEQNKQLYLYGFTVKKGSEKLRYSYTGTIQQEDMSVVIADLAVKKFPGRKVGLMWRNSANFQPGRDAFKRHIVANGGQVVADLPVQRNQGSYTQEIITLQQRGAEVVFILEDTVTQTNIIKQGKSQQYNPNWLTFTYNFQTKTLGNDSLNPPIRGANLSPAYECHQYGGPYASYGAEIKVFEAAYAKYSPNTDLCGVAGDIAWQGWVGFKAFAGLFEACGRDCTRNRFAGIMEGGYKAKIGAACELDFSRDAHHGGAAADLMEAYAGPNGVPAFRNTQRCAKAP